MKSTFSVLYPGAFSTIQDQGRIGFQHLGVPLSGVMDRLAGRLANRLVGNAENEAVLEMTIIGPRLSVLRDAHVALCGADMDAQLNKRPLPTGTSFRVAVGDELAIRQVKKGCRGYLAVGGGFDVPVVMGSRATYVGGKIGGLEGRPLKKGDFLASFAAPLGEKQRSLPPAYQPEFGATLTVRAVAGPQQNFSRESRALFFGQPFTVSAHADRMGYRLDGPQIKMDTGIVSEPVVPGSVQIPPDGQPIILFREQTMGGYAKIATVISVDLSKIAQALPGDTLFFKQVSLEESHRIYKAHEACLETLTFA